VVHKLNLIQTFEETNGIPLLYKNGLGQYDLNNNYYYKELGEKVILFPQN